MTTTRNSVNLICKVHSTYEMYRAVRLSNFSLDMVPICCKLNCFSSALVYDVIGQLPSAYKLREGISRPFVVESDIL